MHVVRKKNEGLCRTLNLGLELARGSFMVFLASDDIMAPAKLRHEVTALSRLGKEVGACYGDMQLVSEAGTLLDRMSFKPAPKYSNQFLDFLMGETSLSLQNSTFRRSVFENIGGFDPELAFEDRDFLLRLLRKYHTQYVGGTSVYYRVVQGSLGKSAHRFEQDHLQMIGKHFEAPELRELGRCPIRKVRSNMWARNALSAMLLNDRECLRSYVKKSIVEWPLNFDAWGVGLLSVLPNGLSRSVLRIRGKYGLRGRE
jgi:glycosyltransferase involved in cell wall biosynthesis